MNEATAPVTVKLRIPGAWSGPQDLIERLPDGCRLMPDSLTLPDGTQVKFGALPADDQFAQIFRSSCRRPATADELATVDRYAVNVVLSGPGGSMEAARAMMQAAAAIVQAGGAGVFIDNSTVAHGGQNWLELTENDSPEALSFAYVALVRGRAEVYTMGMHVLGLRDIVMSRADLEAGGCDIIDMIRYLCEGEQPIGDGHVIADLSGPRFQARFLDGPAELAKGPLHNPFGRVKLVSMRDIAEAN